MNYISNTINKTFKDKYHKDTLKIAINMAWPAIIESFFIAFAGLIDSLMVSSLVLPLLLLSDSPHSLSF